MREPGKSFFIANIPAAIVVDHHEVMYYWQRSLSHATVLHVDAHPDMQDHAPQRSMFHRAHYYKQLRIESFLCPALHYDIAAELYWFHPFSTERRLQYVGHRDRELRTSVRESMVKPRTSPHVIRWKDTVRRSNIVQGEGTVLEQIAFDTPNWVLDIDLDGFCCHKPETMWHVQDKIETVRNYQQRIAELGEILTHLPRPQLITISRSVGQYSYVPAHLVDTVQEKTVFLLRNKYK
jgi:hypothetical protein